MYLFAFAYITGIRVEVIRFTRIHVHVYLACLIMQHMCYLVYYIAVLVLYPKKLLGLSKTDLFLFIIIIWLGGYRAIEVLAEGAQS